MTPDPPALLNLGPRELLAHLLDTLTGELTGPGGHHVSAAREHARHAMTAPDPAQQLEHLERARHALSLAAQERPQPSTAPRPVFTVQTVTPTPTGARLELLHAPPVTLSRSEPLYLQLGKAYGWAWLYARAGTPAVQGYALSPFLIADTAAALGFNLAHLARLHTPHTPEATP